jgi:DNA repair protein NreA
MKLPCGKCGRLEPQWCNQVQCPLFPKVHIPAKESFSGSTPNLFVGRYNYPNVNVGFLATEKYTKHDEPKLWTEEKTPITDIVQFRASLINSRMKGNVKQFPGKYDEMRSLIAQATKAVAIDVDLAKKPTFNLSYPDGTAPHGPSVELKNAALTENVHVPTDVDKILADELLAHEQVQALHQKHDPYYIQKVFAAGLLGKDKKLVPTRWSITAVDDTIGKQHLEKIRTFPVVSEPTAYTGGHYGNYYCILLLPAKFQYELFELYVGNQPTETNVWTDYEAFSGRTNYAASTVGGYYAARLSITEFLVKEKRQASVLAFRFVTDEYTNPLGVWVVREAVDIAMQQKPLKFATNELALQYLRAYARRKFSFPVEGFLEQSKLLAGLKQKNLSDF